MCYVQIFVHRYSELVSNIVMLVMIGEYDFKLVKGLFLILFFFKQG